LSLIEFAELLQQLENKHPTAFKMQQQRAAFENYEKKIPQNYLDELSWGKSFEICQKLCEPCYMRAITVLLLLFIF
jgi:hypothetical protein